ncbi:hypothetical protein E5S67_01323 [Microcoleus sp. IPMA8]|uniref:Uncharacterized protein n=2 Tax=Microcoleus TaxID=44471 RepID=A0ABX2CTD5_9CYAN|nr:hypothetical protein [Microcoleus asticus IPMA8]
MKMFKFVLVLLVMVANLVFVPPSWADAPKTPRYASNPDYIEVSEALTEALNTLKAAKDSPDSAQNYTPKELHKKISQLEFQKYTLETGKPWGQCRNETGKTLAVYGPKGKKAADSSYDNALYFLADGQTTEHKWDCDGIFLPSDVNATDLRTTDQPSEELTGGLAVKIVDGTQFVARANPDTGAVEFNVPTAKVFQPGDANWFVPDVTQAYIDSQLPNAPTEEND